MFDVIVYGASGFTGARAAKYLAQQPGLKLAIAGRDRSKLEAVAAQLGREVPILLADSSDRDAVSKMVAQGRVIVATAGPFAKYGSAVVEACVQHSAHYVDITGETPWVRDMIDRHHASAQQKKVKIIPFCGYDSVPSDLGAWLCMRTLRNGGEGTRHVDALHVAKGGLNGGTFATAMNFAETGDGARMALPFLLSEGSRPPAIVERESQDPKGAMLHEKSGRWTAPFFMGQINTRVVRRSASLMAMEERPYGTDFVYQEYWRAGSRLQAEVMARGMRVMNAAIASALVRPLLKKLGPKPGQGPSEAAVEGGFFQSDLYGLGENGGEVHVKIAGKGDPGNHATIRFLCESALALAEGRDIPERYGVLTPATGIGGVLAERLRAIGMTIDITPYKRAA